MSAIKYISTSALSKKIGIAKAKVDKVLLELNYIKQCDKGYELTEIGKANGGCIKSHPKFGEYIAWREDIQLPNIDTKKENKKYYSATKIGSKYNISARKMNTILSEIGFIQKYLKGWTITELGKQNGGIQKENKQTGIPFVEWDETIFENKTFLNSIKEISGEAGEITQKNIDKSKDLHNFREAFIAKHRATDGHMVRSKAEMLIDNWLYMAEIVHAYERKLPIEEEVYCDFYIPTGKIYIEFWGLENDPKYAKRKETKKAIYKKYNFKLIELTDNEVFNLDDILPRELLKFGVQTY